MAGAAAPWRPAAGRRRAGGGAGAVTRVGAQRGELVIEHPERPAYGRRTDPHHTFSPLGFRNVPSRCRAEPGSASPTERMRHAG